SRSLGSRSIEPSVALLDRLLPLRLLFGRPSQFGPTLLLDSSSNEGRHRSASTPGTRSRLDVCWSGRGGGREQRSWLERGEGKEESGVPVSIVLALVRVVDGWVVRLEGGRGEMSSRSSFENEFSKGRLFSRWRKAAWDSRRRGRMAGEGAETFLI
ncbi:hypothetical protein BDY24DRAFT_405455, partial [Mrakia frigida]|uniref:uncharacterized protein n=1 Tax=Mrakia frigida TaxID=29902 RepID=UPI003FCC0C76